MKTADLCDEYADWLKLCKTAFYSYGKKKEFNGEIRTVEVYEDNSIVKELNSLAYNYIVLKKIKQLSL